MGLFICSCVCQSASRVSSKPRNTIIVSVLHVFCKNVALGNEFSYKNKIKKLHFDLIYNIFKKRFDCYPAIIIS